MPASQPFGTGTVAAWVRSFASRRGRTWVCGPSGDLPSAAGIASAVPGSTSTDYQGNITGCESVKMSIGDPLTIETAATPADTVQSVTR